MKNAFIKSTKSNGFTLIELLVSIGLGVLLSGGIVNIYLQNRQNYIQDEELARLQENARYAINMLKRDLTMAGFFAGLNDFTVTPASLTTDCVAGVDWATDTTFGVDMIDDANTGGVLNTTNAVTWDCIDSSTLIDTSDVVSIKRTADNWTLKDGDLNTGITADDDQWYLRKFEHKSNVDFVQIPSGGTIDPTHATSGSNFDYWEYYSRIYFLRDYSKVIGDDIPTLCLAELRGDDMETNCYVEGIEDMQLEFGIDSDDDSVPDQFVTTPTSLQLEEAMVVRVYLLVRSVNEINSYTNDKIYNLGSKPIAAKNDGFIRRVFTTTVQMRNAKLPNA